MHKMTYILASGHIIYDSRLWMDALFLLLKRVLKQHQIFFKHVYWSVAHNTLMNKIVTVMVFRHSEIKN